MGQLAELVRKKYPGSYDDMKDEELEAAVLKKYPEYADLVDEKESSFKDSLLGKAYEWGTTPTIDLKPAAKKKAEEIAHSDANPTWLKGFLAGAMEGVADVASSMTSPLDALAMATGAGSAALGVRGLKGANTLRRATQALSAPIAAHGAYETIRPDATLAERGMGIVEAALGVAGTQIPEVKPRARVPVAETTPERLALPAGPRFHTGPNGEVIDVNTGVRPRRSSEIPYRRNDIPRFVSGNVDDLNATREMGGGVPFRFGDVIDGEIIPDDIPIRPEQRLLGAGDAVETIEPDVRIGYGRALEEPNDIFTTPKITRPPGTINDAAKEELALMNQKLLGRADDIPDNPVALELEAERVKLMEDFLAARESQGPDLNALEDKIRASIPDDQKLIELTGGMWVPGGVGGGGTRRPPRPGLAGAAVDKLMSSLQASKGLRTQQENSYSREKAMRFAAFDSTKGEGSEWATRAMNTLKGDYKKINRSPLQLDEPEIDVLYNTIKQANITTPEKARAITAISKILNGGLGAVPQRNEIALLDEVFGNGFGEELIELHGGIGAVGMQITKLANTAKAMMSSLDFSAPLRQGITMIHRPEWRGAFKEMFKYFGDEAYYDTAMEQLHKRPTYLLAREAGLFMTKPGTLMSTEEAFANNYLAQAPGWFQAPFKASERAYSGFLDKLRADTFDTLMKNARAMGHEPYELIKNDAGNPKIKPTDVTRNIAKYVNNATGRGKLGSLEKMAPELNSVFWSPRLISSRLNTLNPKFYADLDPFTRKEAIKSLFAMAGAGTIMAGLGAAAGGRINTNPLSSDFAKARFGDNKVLDPWGGFQQPIVAAARFLAGKTETRDQNRLTTVGNFTTNKFSPIASLAYDLATARKFKDMGEYEDRFGNEKGVPREIINRFIPIFVQDFSQLLTDNPDFADTVRDAVTGKEEVKVNPDNLGFAVPPLFGAGVQDYPEPRSTRRPSGFRKLRAD